MSDPLSAQSGAIAWRDWSTAAFRSAAEEDRPVLLWIGVRWSQACRDMVADTFADPSVAAVVRQRFVPVQVDAERRPDIGERYALGGWPTTALLTPRGDLLGGGTFVTAARLAPALAGVAEAWRSRRDEIEARARARPAALPGTQAALTPAAVESTVDAMLLAGFDEAHSGFGGDPRVPELDAVRWAIARARESGHPRWHRVATRTLDSLGWGGLWDEADGDFSRAADLDWASPHTAKLLDTQAGLVSAFLEAWRAFGDDRYRERAFDALAWVRARLADEWHGGFFASQAETGGAPPTIDRTIYTDLNAGMIEASLRASALTGDPSWAEFAIRSLERVVVDTYRPGQGVAHIVGDDRAARGLLGDQIRLAGALLEAHDASAREPYVMLAEEVVRYALRTMWDEQHGGFRDRADDGDEVAWGRLADPVRPFVANCRAASVLARLAFATGEPDLGRLARDTLGAVSSSCADHGPAAAACALAQRDVVRLLVS